MTKKEQTEEQVEVDAIIQQVRRQILARRAAATDGDDAAAQVPVGGRRLPPEFYDHLYRAGLVYNQIQVTEVIRESNVPLLSRLRRSLHQLVVFYVNRLAERQIEANTHLLRALSILAEELEREADDIDSER